MPLASMTGFARAEGSHGAFSWIWEVKSVNARNLDVRCRLPSGLERLEATARAEAPSRFRRGAFTLALNVTRAQGAAALRIDRDFLDRLIDLHGEYADRVAPGPPRLDRLLQVRGVVESADVAEEETARAEREAAMEASLVEALDALAAARREEGARLEAVIRAHLDEIERLTAAARGTAAAQPEGRRRRLREQVDQLLGADVDLPEERLAQEVALLLAKTDVREEIDRLAAHVAAARELVEAGGPVGRQLDFLCQEFNREANTLCAKSWDIDLSRIGLDLKAAIDRLREQVQNIE